MQDNAEREAPWVHTHGERAWEELSFGERQHVIRGCPDEGCWCMEWVQHNDGS